jgi:hypothetical protein
MLNEKEKHLMELTAQLWDAFVESIPQDDRGPRSSKSPRPSGYREKGVHINEDDIHDFRKAIHDLQRIVQARALRNLVNLSLQDLFEGEVKSMYPKAEGIKISIKFTEKHTDITPRSITLGEDGSTVVGKMKPTQDDEDEY